MNDKIFLFTIKNKDGTSSKYATVQMTQFDAESQFDFEISCDHDNIDYTVKEMEDEVFVEDDVIWF
jgi:hypothetical protein